MQLGGSPQHKGRIICRCDLCGTSFLAWTCEERKYCSGRCYHQAQKQPVHHTCGHCGKDFVTMPSRRGKYCSRSCFDAEHVDPRKGKRLIPVTARLEKFSDRSGGDQSCWPWTGGTTVAGYGILRLDGQTRPAHAVSYETYVGPIPEGCEIMHRCDNPPCINPTHLRAVPHRVNMDDAKAKGRMRGGAINPPRGEDHASSILTEDQALQIHALRAEGVPFREIGRRFGVSEATARAICKGKRWAHLMRSDVKV